MRYVEILERVYHGSPHKFDRFSLDHVGKGEGVQAYGYGLYFSSKREVAEFYRDNVGYTQAIANKTWTAPKGVPQKTGEHIVNILSSFFGYADPNYIMMTLRKSVSEIPDSERYTKQLRDNLKSYERHVSKRSTQVGDELQTLIQKRLEDRKAELETQERQLKKDKILARVLPYITKYGIQAFVAPGHVYHAEIAPSEDEFLLWDAGLNKQPGPVTAALAKVDHPVINEWRKNGAWDHVSGQTFYSVLSGGMTYGNVAGQKKASAELLSLGIAGIKYLDAQSREIGAGTYNYVVFNDEHVSMTDRHGP
jgi:hypothetical protein